MTEKNLHHPNEEALERFLLGTLPKDELAVVETHILACDVCVEQLEAMETGLAALKIALRDFDVRPKPAKSWLSFPKLSLASAGAFLAALVIYLSIPQRVELTAYRGSEMTTVQGGRPLKIHLNAVDLESGPVAVELVNRRGVRAWRGSAVVEHDAVEVVVPRITKSGNYFLRLYSARDESELLREFSVRASWAVF